MLWRTSLLRSLYPPRLRTNISIVLNYDYEEKQPAGPDRTWNVLSERQQFDRVKQKLSVPNMEDGDTISPWWHVDGPLNAGTLPNTTWVNLSTLKRLLQPQHKERHHETQQARLYLSYPSLQGEFDIFESNLKVTTVGIAAEKHLWYEMDKLCTPCPAVLRN